MDVPTGGMKTGPQPSLKIYVGLQVLFLQLCGRFGPECLPAVPRHTREPSHDMLPSFQGILEKYRGILFMFYVFIPFQSDPGFLGCPRKAISSPQSATLFGEYLQPRSQ